MSNKVLIVEDNELNLKLFHDLLVIQQCEVISSRDGIGVVELATRESPDLILMDIHLNGLSGIDIIKDLKLAPTTAHIPIVAVTAFAMQNDEAKIYAAGCDRYISKPLSIDLFFSVINEFIK